ncbi:class I SAM-dependent methyltransferase [Roseimaritima ulvae]|uniref:Ubiquinone/menaquinone biosynthesis C-methyltransferase UbiE n=1 Tax=Roseimaritima ulvae TaxID=980254 RepID=A0A5B9QRS4_9BACT|nr:class I SAM-dependent methyltransferase [Roseimaritima ulvae]QEG41704.1 Ubiquinone/menaquinone biosynthesis C-methyltransferase UbiE [Roseimaritima ulvae]
MSEVGTTTRRNDLRTLWHLLFHRVRGETHAERLESFYTGQAEGYDNFRSRLLHGRKELIEQIPFVPEAVWVDLGAGTGENLLHAGRQVQALQNVHLVDLTPSLLRVAQQRINAEKLANVQTHCTDATTFSLPDNSVDVVTFSYSLTMIPDWFAAVSNAVRMLRPGGTLAVVDFYVSRKFAADGHHQHGGLRRAFWSHWFAADNVFLNGDHAAMLHRETQVRQFSEHTGRVPYLPFVKAPYYLFVGTKPVAQPRFS